MNIQDDSKITDVSLIDLKNLLYGKNKPNSINNYALFSLLDDITNERVAISFGRFLGDVYLTITEGFTLYINDIDVNKISRELSKGRSVAVINLDKNNTSDATPNKPSKNSVGEVYFFETTKMYEPHYKAKKKELNTFKNKFSKGDISEMGKLTELISYKPSIKLDLQDLVAFNYGNKVLYGSVISGKLKGAVEIKAVCDEIYESLPSLRKIYFDLFDKRIESGPVYIVYKEVDKKINCFVIPAADITHYLPDTYSKLAAHIFKEVNRITSSMEKKQTEENNELDFLGNDTLNVEHLLNLDIYQSLGKRYSLFNMNKKMISFNVPSMINEALISFFNKGINPEDTLTILAAKELSKTSQYIWLLEQDYEAQWNFYEMKLESLLESSNVITGDDVEKMKQLMDNLFKTWALIELSKSTFINENVSAAQMHWYLAEFSKEMEVQFKNLHLNKLELVHDTLKLIKE